MWDVETAQAVSRIKIAKGVNLARLFPTGDRLAATFDDMTVRVYELASGEKSASAHQTGRTVALAVSPDAARVYWAGFFGDAVLWSWIPGENPKPLLKEVFTFEKRCGLSLSRDGAELWCFFEWDLVGFDTQTGAELARFRGSRSEDLGDGFVLSSERCAVAVVSVLNRDDEPVRPRLRKWNLESGRTLWNSGIMRISPDGSLLTMARSERWLASASKDGVTFHSMRSGRAFGVLPFEVPGAGISCLSLSPNDRFLAVGTSNGDLIVYDLGDSIHESRVAVPRIAACSRNGSPLLLRLRNRTGQWLKVHENGDLERAEGDALSDTVVTPFIVSDPGPRLTEHPARLHMELCRRLQQYDLTKPPPWGQSHPVQVFIGGELVVEGYVGVESDMEAHTDIFGLDFGLNAENPSVGERLDGNLSARRILDGIVGLLALLPTD
ncbi:WD40 repeat domain-containing protein [Archangium lansingense]|uniref:WD40 repeat domain-containing protein n=1 Tax=Archangium lansingense TaxID=2995310 RepID=A0ABT3ZYT1_9BACT|nr:hypothetical protein [Archangium lansinium]MCY1073822.1 hypothetical protein [Archangium lansinium]